MYKIEIEKKCLKELKKLDKQIIIKAFAIIKNKIAKDPYQGKSLQGPFQGLYSYRFSDFRVIYEIIDKKITVVILRIRHRKNVYDGF